MCANLAPALTTCHIVFDGAIVDQAAMVAGSEVARLGVARLRAIQHVDLVVVSQIDFQLF